MNPPLLILGNSNVKVISRLYFVI